MERERRLEHDGFRYHAEGPPNGDSLEQQRSEIEELLQTSERVFDAINNIQAQQYLEQNLQTGGQ